MWDSIFKYLPDPLGWLCTFLAFFIPYITYKINQNIHKNMIRHGKRKRKKVLQKGSNK